MGIVAVTFLGWDVEGGVEQRMADRLAAVEVSLRREWSGSGSTDDFISWCGIRETHKGFHRGGYHGQGIAIDLDYTTNPYIATRTGSTYGGEAGFPDAAARRQRAAEAYDRAVAFAFTEGDAADVSIRVHDTIETTYDRFRFASDCLAYYLSHVFAAQPVISRGPIPDAYLLGDDDPAFGAIDGGEFLAGPEEAVAAIDATMSSADDQSSWADRHPTWPWTAQAQYWQILRDYETVRAPMLFGRSSDPIASTRNPANGLMDLHREVVLAMVNVGGMKWGACDFGSGASGDMMHFDLGQH